MASTQELPININTQLPCEWSGASGLVGLRKENQMWQPSCRKMTRASASEALLWWYARALAAKWGEQTATRIAVDGLERKRIRRAGYVFANGPLSYDDIHEALTAETTIFRDGVEEVDDGDWFYFDVQPQCQAPPAHLKMIVMSRAHRLSHLTAPAFLPVNVALLAFLATLNPHLHLMSLASTSHNLVVTM
jgi:hypothetical protein